MVRVRAIVRRRKYFSIAPDGIARLGEAHQYIDRCLGRPYGVRLCSAYTLRDQLGLVPGTKSKIEDGSAVGTSVTFLMTVGDFR